MYTNDFFLNERIIDQANNTLKSEEEIQRYTIKENLTEQQRTIYIYENGDSIQKQAILNNIPKIIQQDPSTEEKLISLLISKMSAQEDHIKVLIAKCFQQMIQKCVSPNFKKQNFLKDMFQLSLNMMNQNNQEAALEWTLVIQELIPKIDFELIKNQIFDYIIENSKMTSKDQEQLKAAKLFQFCLDADQEKKINFSNKIFQQFEQIALLSEQVRILFIESLFQKIFNYYKDNNEYLEFWKQHAIKISQTKTNEFYEKSINMFANTIQFYKQDQISEQILPQIFQYLKNQDKLIQECITFHLGKIICGLKEYNFKEEESEQIFKFIQNQLNSSNTQIKINILYNFPSFIANFGRKSSFWKKFKQQYIQILTKEKIIDIRLQAIKSFLGVVEAVNEIEIGQIFNKISHINLTDNEYEIRLITLEQVQKILKYFKNNPNASFIYDEIKFDSLLTDFYQILEEDKKNCGWKMIILAIDIIQENIKYFEPKEIQDTYLDTLVNLCANCSNELKLTVIKNIVEILKQQNEQIIIQDIINKVQCQFMLSTNYLNRILYIEFVMQMQQTFSWQFLQEYNLYNVFDLAQDQIKNVKIKLARHFTDLRLYIDKDENSETLSLFQNAYFYLKQEKKIKEVQEHLQQYENFMKDEQKFNFKQIQIKEANNEKYLKEQTLKQKFLNLTKNNYFKISNQNNHLSSNSLKINAQRQKKKYSLYANSSNTNSSQLQQQQPLQQNKKNQFMSKSHNERKSLTKNKSLQSSNKRKLSDIKNNSQIQQQINQQNFNKQFNSQVYSKQSQTQEQTNISINNNSKNLQFPLIQNQKTKISEKNQKSNNTNNGNTFRLKENMLKGKHFNSEYLEKPIDNIKSSRPYLQVSNRGNIQQRASSQNSTRKVNTQNQTKFQNPNLEFQQRNQIIANRSQIRKSSQNSDHTQKFQNNNTNNNYNINNIINNKLNQPTNFKYFSQQTESQNQQLRSIIPLPKKIYK